MDLIAEGLRQKLIRFEDDKKYVVYVDQAKRRRYDQPEEKVQVETYLKLILRYKYPVERDRCYVPVQMGSNTREADLIVYAEPTARLLLILDESVQPKAKKVSFNLQGLSQLRFKRSEDLGKKLKKQLESFFTETSH